MTTLFKPFQASARAREPLGRDVGARPAVLVLRVRVLDVDSGRSGPLSSVLVGDDPLGDVSRLESIAYVSTQGKVYQRLD